MQYNRGESMIRVKIHLQTELVDDVLSILYRYDCQGVEIQSHETLTEQRNDAYGEVYQLNPDDYPDRGTILLSYFNQKSTDSIINQLKQEVEDFVPLLFQPIEVIELEDIDYIKRYEESVKELRIDSLSIVPPWYDEMKCGRDYIVIEPGTGFGTGSHETTKSCLRLIHKYIHKNDDIIDVGTGSGILALRAAMLTKGEVFAVEVDPMAKKNAIHNAELNKQRIHFFDSLTDVHQKFDLLIANIVTPILIELLPLLNKRLKPGGTAILSGILREEEQLIEQRIIEAYFTIVEKWCGDMFLSYVIRLKD